MSGKRLNPLADTPMSSSSDEEGEEIRRNSSSEEEEDESTLNPTVKKQETVKKQVSDSESGSEEETDSESGSDEETDSECESQRKEVIQKPDSSVAKPPAETRDLVVAKNHDSEKSETRKRSSAKNVAAASSADPKRVKRVSGEDEKKSGGGEEEPRKTYFQRVWSEEDEISVLQAFIDYKNDTGSSPYDDKDAFLQLVKKSISFDVSKTQVLEKLRCLKKKLKKNLGKAKNGEEPTFSKPHDRKAFDLSKFVWGANGMLLESAVKSNGNSKKRKKVEPVKQDLVSQDKVANKGDSSSLGIAKTDTFVKSALVKSLAHFGVDDLAAQQGWSRLALEDKKRFEEQWEEMQLREYLRKSNFIYQVVTKMGEAFRPNA